MAGQDSGTRRSSAAERLYQQLDLLQPVRQEARRDLLVESHQHHAVKLLRQIPSIGPIRAALLVGLLQTPHRFRTQRQLWLTVVSQSRLMTAVSTASREGSWYETGSASPCAV